MPRRKPMTREEAFEARRALTAAAQDAHLPWAAGVRSMRKALGMTQEQFAKAFKLTVRQVSQIETGAANPTVETLTRLAKPFGLTLGFIPAPPSPTVTPPKKTDTP